MNEVNEGSRHMQVAPASRQDVYSVQHDWESDDALSVTVAKVVSVVAGVPPTELEPLHHVVDTDALETLFQPLDGETRPENSYVSFPFSGHNVTVYADGVVVVETLGSDVE